MNLQELQNHMKSNDIPNLLIFFGEEIAVMDIYLKKIVQILNYSVIQCSSVREAYSKLNQRTMLGNSRLFIVRDDAEFVKADKEWAKVFKLCESTNDALLLVFNKIDKRSKFFKHNQERMCEFERLSANVLQSYIEKLIPGARSFVADQLIEICDYSYSRILLECDKVKIYSSVSGLDYSESFRHLLKTGVINKPIGDITFKFTDSILMRNKQDAIEYLSQAKLINESAVLTLSVLYSGFRSILLVQGLGNLNNSSNSSSGSPSTSKRTGLTPWQVKLAKQKMGHYSIAELINALKIIRFAEKGIKNGTVDPDMAVDYVMVNIM